MNGTPSRNTISGNRVPGNTTRPLPFNDLFPPGSNLRPLSNQNYFANIVQGSRSAGMVPSRSASSQSTFASPKNAGSIASQSISVGGAHGLGEGVYRGSSALSTAANVSGTLKSASGALSVAGGPVGAAAMLAQVSQQIGESTAGFIKSDNEKTQREDYLSNLAAPGIASSSSAAAIKSEQQTKINDQYNGAMTGALFGPLGALAGHFIAQLLSSGDRGVFNMNTFSGGRDASDNGLVSSASSRAPLQSSNQIDRITDGKSIATDSA